MIRKLMILKKEATYFKMVCKLLFKFSNLNLHWMRNSNIVLFYKHNCVCV